MNSSTFWRWLLLLVCSMALCACSEDPVQPKPEPPVIEDPYSIPVFINEWSTEGNTITLDSNGLLYVLSSFVSEVQVFSPGGIPVDTWDPTPDNEIFLPTHLDFVGDGFVFMADGFPKPSRITMFDGERKYVDEWFEKYDRNGMASGTDPLAIGPDGSIYTVDWDHEAIIKYSSAGVFESEWASLGTDPAGTNFISGIVVSPDNTVYASDTLHNRILMFSGEGEFLGEFGGLRQGDVQLNWPHGLAIDDQDILYIADTFNNRIMMTDLSGEYRGHFEAGGAGQRSFLVAAWGRHVYVLTGGGLDDNRVIRHYMYEG